MKLCKIEATVSWILQLVGAGILLQTLYFKFTGAEESVYIFSKLGVEPWGRIGTGCLELVASVMLLVPRTIASGALLAGMLMVGAIGSHLTVLGISVMNDGGELFALAVVVLACSAIILYIRRREIPIIGPLFMPLDEMLRHTCGGCNPEESHAPNH